MGKEPVRLSMVILGHAQTGKATTSGHLLWKCGGIDKRTAEKVEREAADRDHPNKYTLLLAQLTEWARNCNYYIPSLRYFESPRLGYTIVDAPSHRDFLGNPVVNNSLADVALVMLSATHGEFEASMSPNGQTKGQILLAYLAGIRHVIVAVNKMEACNWSKRRYDEVKAEVSICLSRVGYDPEKIPFVPFSSWTGENLIEPAPACLWYPGPTLLQALDTLPPPPARPADRPLRIPVQDVYKIGGIGIVSVGRVESGTIKRGMNVVIAPSIVTGVVCAVEKHHESLPLASAGDAIGFSVQNLNIKDVRRGYVAGDASRDPPVAAESFIAQVIILDYPGEITVGYTPTIGCHSAHVACRFEKLLNKIDRRHGLVLEENPTSLHTGDCATVLMIPTKPLVVESFAEYPALGRIAIREHQRSVAVGVIQSVVKKTPSALLSDTKGANDYAAHESSFENPLPLACTDTVAVIPYGGITSNGGLKRHRLP